MPIQTRNFDKMLLQCLLKKYKQDCFQTLEIPKGLFKSSLAIEPHNFGEKSRILRVGELRNICPRWGHLSHSVPSQQQDRHQLSIICSIYLLRNSPVFLRAQKHSLGLSKVTTFIYFQSTYFEVVRSRESSDREAFWCCQLSKLYRQEGV